MTPKNTLTVTVALKPYSFEAEACFRFSRPISELSFLLNDALSILNATDEKGELISYFGEGAVTPTFRPLSKKIVVRRGKPFRSLVVRYRGTAQYSDEKRQNWHNAVTPDFVSLNWYSVWFPEEVSVPIGDDRMIVRGGSRWFVVKGEYDETGDRWLYGGRGYDAFNLVAFARDKLLRVESPRMDLCFLDERLAESAERCVRTYETILDYYNGTLFDEREIKKTDVVCAFPIIKTGGAYRREGLIWCVSPEADPVDGAYLLAHETAHIWCNGANAGSWEDWLNEATADWAALLFALERGNTALFKRIITPALEKAPTLPPIKTVDGSRPEGVHEKGTALLYRVYEKYGAEVMAEIVRCFSRLNEKNTNSLLAELKKLGLADAAAMIAVGIE
ncbi:MAG: hypothetical protein NC084_04505 [Bacteroides sp.]|nr:hypothetical protein [Eubacterium sp.]MCM1419767.1 hypothetical protein [Roseburia sp.]MCM1461960.1 hypothetical protein [Bacteroides sp.]